jgi:MoxR-like ATPase
MSVQRLGFSTEDISRFCQPQLAVTIRHLGESEVRYISESREYLPCLERILRLEEQLNDTLEGKEEIVRLLLACTIAQVPMILLGPPGTAKSLVIREFCSLLGLRPHHEDIHSFEQQLKETLSGGQVSPDRFAPSSRELFEYLLTRFTTPEEVIGPVNINALLKLSLFYREPEGMLPAAEIAFLDEIFKANSAILNSLLAIINERIYYNAGRVFDVNLVNVFGASNEPPDAEELAALYDRFPIRAVSRPVRDDQVDRLLDRAVRYGYRQALLAGNGHDPSAPPRAGRQSAEPIACVNDFRLLAKVILYKYGGPDQFHRVPFGQRGFSFEREFINLFRQLRTEFQISDRTPERLVRVARALALLDRRDHLEPEDLRVFKYCTPDIDTADVLADVVEEYIATCG